MAEEKFELPSFKSLFELEEHVLEFWAKDKTFQKSLDKTAKGEVFSFYDGPPFITGLPHYATLLPSIAKDIIPRYQTMKGKYVRRQWGWDTHGLPAENQVEKKLGLKSKKDIEALGIDKFIAACREYVGETSEAWRWYIDHIGRWVDMDNAYRTDNLDYMETVLWVFKTLYDKGLIYQGRRVSLYCPRCATPLSKFEITMDDGNYRDVEDPAVTVKFKLVDDPSTSSGKAGSLRAGDYFLAWTTTPWTLPANLALAVDPKAEYVRATDGKETYILAHQALERYRDFDLEIIETFKGEKLVGQKYEPLYKFFATKPQDFQVYAGDFVSMDEGTGIVHIAPGFGEDDTKLGEKNNLSLALTLTDEGHFVPEVKNWAGQYYKKANPGITADLQERGLLFKEETITHSYPHCYRCGTPLIYKSQVSWYLKLDRIREQLLEKNHDVNWVPKHFGDGRFAYNIQNAPDWSISRSRYWGTPLPVWQAEDGETIVPGSVAELEELSGTKITDLHRPKIDEVFIERDGKKFTRVKDVLDVWFESGSMPYGQFHYPFQNEQEFEQSFPADFIIEYTGQLRGWFYYLHLLANALKHENAFKNVVVTGVLMGTDGRKMSKSYGNYPDPKQTIEKYGAEALRLYFMGSKIMAGEDLTLDETGIRDEQRLLQVLHNSVRYFVTYANVHNFQPKTERPASTQLLDRWLELRLEEFIYKHSTALDAFDFVAATKEIRPFIEDLSTWYIRRSRERFVNGDKEALCTLEGVIIRFADAIAPTLPFSAEIIHHVLTGKTDSVHLQNYPVSNMEHKEDADLLGQMAAARQIVSVAHQLRAEMGVSLRQPLAVMDLTGLIELKASDDVLAIIKDEVNVGSITFNSALKSFKSAELAPGQVISLDPELTPELKEEGRYRELVRLLQDARKKAGLAVGQKVTLSYITDNEALAALLHKRAKDFQKDLSLNALEKAASGEGLTTIANEKLAVKFGI
ncbi:MAG TPA: isoleucine--tRNA ligase [Candidatus Saccharimonadales bacterium]|nr:isoleucine--tRNA ligase [Candidatus Saccharimonadales bacterium]